MELTELLNQTMRQAKADIEKMLAAAPIMSIEYLPETRLQRFWRRLTRRPRPCRHIFTPAMAKTWTSRPTPSEHQHREVLLGVTITREVNP